MGKKRTTLVGVLLGLALVVAAASSALPARHLLAPPSDALPDHVASFGLDSQLAAIARLKGGAALAAARTDGLDVSNGDVRVVVASAGEIAPAQLAVIAAGGHVADSAAGLVEATVPVESLRALATDPAVARVRTPAHPFPQAVGEGLSPTNTYAWKAAGYDGTGVKVAVIDVGFNGWNTLLGTSLPASVTTIDRCGGNFAAAPANGGTKHGAAVAEVVHQFAPGAQLLLICIDTEVDLARAEQDAVAAGVKVVVHSIGWLGTSRGDGSGPPGSPDATVAAARAAGIPWVNAAGNYAQQHWSGTFHPNSIDSRFSDFVTGNVANTVTIQSGEEACMVLKWDAWPTTSEDFDLLLFRQSTGGLVAVSDDDQSSAPGEPTEGLCYQNTGAAGAFAIAIIRYSAVGTPRFDLYYDGSSNLQYRTTAGSVAEPASSPDAFAVGAFCWFTGALEPYSSQGLTIDGRSKPELAAPDSLSTTSLGQYASPGCGTGFAGSSASAGAVGGAAALIVQRNPSLDVDGVESALLAAAKPKESGAGAGDLWLPGFEGVERESFGVGGAAPNGDTYSATVTPDGRYVTFSSLASNLVAGDTNGFADVFVRDRQTGATTRVSVASDGSQGTGRSDGGSVSDDGRYVAFESDAWNLVPGDSNGRYDGFVRDLHTGTTVRIDVDSAGHQSAFGLPDTDAPVLSGNGRYVVFSSYSDDLVAGDTNNHTDIFVHDMQTGATTRVSVSSEGDQTCCDSFTGTITPDGRYVAFQSQASNLVPDDTNNATDIFVHDNQTGSTTRVSLGNGGLQQNGFNNLGGRPSMSGDGRFVSWDTLATNLHAGDTNQGPDVYVRDRQTNQTFAASATPDGLALGNAISLSATLSRDGRYVALLSGATNLVSQQVQSNTSVYVRNLVTGTTRLALERHGSSYQSAPVLTRDGSLVTFASGDDLLGEGLTTAQAYVSDYGNGTLAGPPATTVQPTVALGTIAVAQPGHWNSTSAMRLSFQWRRCTSAESGCGDIAGAVGRRYVPTAADAGFTLRVAVTGTNASGSQTATSTASPVFRPSGPFAPVLAAPSAVSAVPGNGQATVSFAPPPGAIGLVTVTASPGGASATGTTSPIVVTGLANGTAYTFTAKAVTGSGSSAASAPSAAVIPFGVPDAPTAVTATPGDGQAAVTFTPPAFDGGRQVAYYTVTASPGGFAGSGTGNTVVVFGLTNGQSYTFTVTATSPGGTTLPSAASSPVTPEGASRAHPAVPAPQPRANVPPFTPPPGPRVPPPDPPQ